MLVSYAFTIGVALALSQPDCSAVCGEMAREIHSTCPRPDPRFRTMFHNVNENDNLPSDWIPDQGCDRCPVLESSSTFRSLNLPQARQTKFQFHNSAPEIVHVYWHDGNGRAHFKSTLNPGGFYGVGTWEGHAFRVWNKDQTAILLDFTVGRLPLSNPHAKTKKACRLSIQDKRLTGRRLSDSGRARTWTKAKNEFQEATWNAAPGMSMKTKPTVRTEEDFKGVDWRRARFVGFVNRASTDLDMYFVRNQEEISVGKIPSSGVAYQITYHTHKFRAKIADSSLTVSEVKISDIEIPDCPQRRRCNCGAIASSEPLAIKNQGALNMTDTEANEISGIIVPSISAHLLDGVQPSSLNGVFRLNNIAL